MSRNLTKKQRAKQQGKSRRDKVYWALRDHHKYVPLNVAVVEEIRALRREFKRRGLTTVTAVEAAGLVDF